MKNNIETNLNQNYLQIQLLRNDKKINQIRTIDRIKNNYGQFINGHQDGKVIDIGPGRGEMIQVYKDLGFQNISCIDIAEDVVDHIQNCYEIESILTENTAHYFESKENNFSVVTMLHVLEHIDILYATKLLRAINKSLTKDGILIIEVPNSANMFTGNAIWSSDITHKTQYTNMSLEQILLLSDFLNVQIHGIKPKGLSPARLIQRLLIYLLDKMQIILTSIYLPPERFIHSPTIFAVASPKDN